MKTKELFQKPTTIETEQIIKTNAAELNVVQYATIPGVKGTQFGKEVFSTMLQFKDLATFLNVFPEVQRTASPRKIRQIKNYIVSGIEDKTNWRFFSGITATARGHVFYDETTRHIAIDTTSSQLSLNDGQHRLFGIGAAIEEIQKKKFKAKSQDVYELYERYEKELSEMVIPVVLFNNISADEEKQLFTDLNQLASRPSRSSTIRLSQTDLFSRLSREVSAENHYLLKYGVEYNLGSIHGNNLNTILLTTVYVFARSLFQQELKANHDFLTEKNYETVKKYVNDTFNKLFAVLPQDLHVKNKYILSKGSGLRGLAQFIYESRNDLTIKNDDIYLAISKVNFEEDLSFWSSYGATQTASGIIQFGGHGQGGINAVRKACMNALLDLQD